MSLSFGPAALPVIPTSADEVVVTRRGGQPVVFTDPVSVDDQGRVSFTVSETGKYTIAISHLGTTYEHSVVLSPDSMDLYSVGAMRSNIEEIATNGADSDNVQKVMSFTTDDAERISGTYVTWIDQRAVRTNPPINMGPLDFWVDSIPVQDTENPTAPGDVDYSSLTDTSVSISWTAGTDNVAVVGYNYRINGGEILELGQVLTVDLTDLDPETEYTVEVQSRDAADNVSAWGSTTFTTDAAAPPSTLYSVYGESAPTGTWVWADGATPYIVTARGFSCSTAGARAAGARAWIPDDASGDLPTEATFYLYGPDAGPDSAPVETKVVSLSGASAGSWVVGMFDTPESMEVGETWMIGVRFTGGSDAGKYAFGTNTRDNSNAVISIGPLAEELAWVAQAGGTVNLSSNYKIGTASAASPAEQTQSYGIDILVDIV